MKIFAYLRIPPAREEHVPVVVIVAHGHGLPLSCSHSRNPPRKALSLFPARQFCGSVLSLRTLPPPSTVSSGSSAAIRRATTSATSRRHFFLPRRSSPAFPT